MLSSLSILAGNIAKTFCSCIQTPKTVSVSTIHTLFCDHSMTANTYQITPSPTPTPGPPLMKTCQITSGRLCTQPPSDYAGLGTLTTITGCCAPRTCASDLERCADPPPPPTTATRCGESVGFGCTYFLAAQLGLPATAFTDCCSSLVCSGGTCATPGPGPNTVTRCINSVDSPCSYLNEAFGGYDATTYTACCTESGYYCSAGGLCATFTG